MAYILNKSNGQQFLVLNDGITDTSVSPLSFVGKNVSNYGDEQNQNFLYLLENFANGSIVGGQPRSPVTGQLWFDTSFTVNRMLAFDGTSWRPLAVSMYDTTASNTTINALSNPRYPFASSQPGDFFVNSVTKQMFVVTSTATDMSLIGPEGVPGYGMTRMLSSLMYDTLGNPRPVVKLTVDDEVICVLSKTTFSTTDTGFPNVYRGITFKDYNTSTRYNTIGRDLPGLYGLHDQLDTSYPRRNIDEHIQNSWYMDDGSSLKFGTDGFSSIGWTPGSSSIDITSTSTIRLIAQGTQLVYNSASLRPQGSVDLGTSSNPFNQLNVNDIVAVNTITSSRMYEDGFRVLTSATLPTVGVTDIAGTTNQIEAVKTQGAVTLSLSNTVNLNEINSNRLNSSLVYGGSIFDSNARVITTATLPYSISTITGVANQLSVSVNDRTALIGFPNSVTMSDLTATTINSPNIFQAGHRVLTTATISDYAVVAIQGTTNQISASNNDGVVTIGLPSAVTINTLNVTTATTSRLNASQGNITNLTAGNALATLFTATTVNVTGVLNAASIGSTDISVSNDLTVYNDITATNIYAAANLSGFTINGSYGNFSTQLNASYASISTLTVLNNIAATGGITSGGTIAGNTVNAAQANISGVLSAGTINATGNSNFSGGTQKVRDVIEQVSLVGTPPSGTVNVNLIGSSIVYYTSATTGNWTLNFRGDSSVAANSYLATGQSVTVTLLVTQGSGAGYYPTACNIDGVPVTPKWFGGLAPDSGDPDCVNAFTFTIVKTGSNVYSLFASVMKYA